MDDEQRAADRLPLILTIGHSRRPLEEFIDLLWSHGVSCVVDVRAYPRSRFPHFNGPSLARSLPEAGVAYLSLTDLGSMRTPWPVSPNMGLKMDLLRGFADHMQTDRFREALDVLLRVAEDEQVAILCAEGLPWKCHRLLISDALTVRGYSVEHILTGDTRVPHVLSPLARYEDGELTYPPRKKE